MDGFCALYPLICRLENFHGTELMLIPLCFVVPYFLLSFFFFFRFLYMIFFSPPVFSILEYHFRLFGIPLLDWLFPVH